MVTEVKICCFSMFYCYLYWFSLINKKLWKIYLLWNISKFLSYKLTGIMSYRLCMKINQCKKTRLRKFPVKSERENIDFTRKFWPLFITETLRQANRHLYFLLTWKKQRLFLVSLESHDKKMIHIIFSFFFSVFRIFLVFI